MHRGLYGFGGKHRRQAVGEVDHRVAELPELIEGGDLDFFARDELRDPFFVIDLGEARLVVFAHRPRLRILRRAKDLRVVFRWLAAPVHWWRLGLGVARPLGVGNLGIDLAVGQGVDATRRIAFWTVLAETPRFREYARWLITGMFLFPK